MDGNDSLKLISDPYIQSAGESIIPLPSGGIEGRHIVATMLILGLCLMFVPALRNLTDHVDGKTIDSHML